MRDTDLAPLIDGALALEKLPIARLVSLFEDMRPVARDQRQSAIRMLDQRTTRRGVVIGITGTPGAGKSTLIGELGVRLIGRDDQTAAAVLAVDPSSHISGGALLGDRTRVRFPLKETRLFFRSQASDRDLGGMSRSTFQVCRLLQRLFDVVFIETVGIGQSEVEVRHLADRLYLVLAPLGGDQIQFMKAGIMEVPDVFVLNKYDTGEVARRSFHALKASLQFVRPDAGHTIPIFKTSATHGDGLDELVAHMATVEARHEHGDRDRNIYFLGKWVREAYGKLGLRCLDDLGGADALLLMTPSFDLAQDAFDERFGDWAVNELS